MEEKEMQQVKVYISEKNLICISQDEIYNDEPNVVVINPGQVDLLIKWLNEAKEELKEV